MIGGLSFDLLNEIDGRSFLWENDELCGVWICLRRPSWWLDPISIRCDFFYGISNFIGSDALNELCFVGSKFTLCHVKGRQRLWERLDRTLIKQFGIFGFQTFSLSILKGHTLDHPLLFFPNSQGSKQGSSKFQRMWVVSHPGSYRFVIEVWEADCSNFFIWSQSYDF